MRWGSSSLLVRLMFPFSALNKTAEAPEVTPNPAKSNDPHPLDALTGGAFSAHTSTERTARIRDWLAGEPSAEQMQSVFKEISGKDKGAAKLLREKLQSSPHSDQRRHHRNERCGHRSQTCE